MISLEPNEPLQLPRLRDLLRDRQELFLVWPDAHFPFDASQWRQALTARPGHRSYFVMQQERTIGHGALLESDEPHVMTLSYLYIAPDCRGQGHGRDLVGLLEAEARARPSTTALRLRVRIYNARALYIYRACGFRQSERHGNLVIMRKELRDLTSG